MDKKYLLVTLGLAAVLVVGGYFLLGYGGSARKLTGKINIAWAEWAPSEYLKELSKDFTKETGVEVNIIQTPWPTYYDVVFKELAKKGDKFDLVVGDSQWLGEGAKNGYYVELTKWVKDHKVDKTMTAATVAGYSEYPAASGKYWAVPAEGDANGIAYRKDLFEDPKEMAAFKKAYGYDLAVPKTWQQYRDIAEFFTRPKQGLYGASIWTAKAYDGITLGFQPLLWSWGANLGDAKTYKVQGILNSKEGVEALKFYKELYKFTPPESRDSIYWPESNKLFMDGKAAMVMNYFAFFPELADSKINKYAATTGYFPMPGGPAGTFSSLGGQGISVIGFSKNKEAAFGFLEWFIKKSTQEKWAALGGFTCDKEVLNSAQFQQATPYNKAFAQSMEAVKDFWAVPEYAQLLEVSQKYWNQYVTQGGITAEGAMSSIAREWENIFEYAGYYKE